MRKVIYPEDYENRGQVDESYIEEANHVENHIVNSRDLEKEDTVLYRGWMLSHEEYEQYMKSIARRGAKMIVGITDYYASHHINNWYDILKDLTPETVFLERETLKEDFDTKNLQWDSYFVKDSVKSLNTKRGSIAKNYDEVVSIVEEIKKYRGIEGVIALRKVHQFVEDTEVRYFCVKGEVYSPNGYISPIAIETGKRMAHLPFISIDVIKDTEGKEWLVEIGDGQVSGVKNWDTETFVNDVINKIRA